VIIDASAVMAILLREPEKDLFPGAVLAEPQSAMSAGTWIELAAVITRKQRDDLEESLRCLLLEGGVRIVAVTPDQAELGHRAYRKFGIGSGHRARLNLGGCFAYALAKEGGEPLLYKGDDFVQADIVRAV
jgi:ribonuclease VapC